MKKLNMGYSRTPKKGVLSYALRGQTTVRPQAHGGKASIHRSTGIYHGSNVSTTKGK
jgi:hypothetical protein